MTDAGALPGERAERSSLRRSVVSRVLWSYALVVLTFAVVAGWSALALRSAAREAALMRSGYYPLSLVVRDLAAKQDIYNSQLNHITSARNPADLRVWFDFALKIGRPKMFGQVRAAIARAFLASGESEAGLVGRELLAEVSLIDSVLAGDAERLSRLFDALERRDDAAAERLRDELVTRGSQGSLRLARLEDRVESEIDRLLDQARGRERVALPLLIGLSSVSLLVGVAMALYARRVLAPLGRVTERAKAVARGDLLPRAPIVSGDEIGELSTTFEGMVSAIARANDQLLAAERLATIGKMAAHVTHEIRNPLSSIALNLELLDEELGASSGEAEALLRAIGSEVDRLNSLSQQYLSFARQKPGVAEEDLAEVVREASEFVRRELAKSDVRLELRIEESLGPVPIDEGQIKQAVFNLLRNARDAMPQGGTIVVSLRSVAGGVEVVIDDEGTGLDANARARLFEPFFTTKRHGTGLGLAITRQMVEAHGGSIEFSDRHPRGTRVTMRLPRPAAVERAEAEVGPAAGADASRDAASLAK
jgi:signal transduction histidine kinase